MLDKPFVFALREDTSGLLIVAGYVAAPDAPEVAADVPARSARSASVKSAEQRCGFGRMPAPLDLPGAADLHR